MTLYKTGAELKDMAKYKLDRNYGISIFAFLTVGMLEVSGTLFLDQIIPCRNFAEYIMYNVVIFFLSVFLGVFQTGTCLFYLNMACGQPYKLDDLFYGFQNNPKASLRVAFFTEFIAFIAIMPFRAAFYQYMETQNNFLLFASIALLVFCTLFTYPIRLSFAQSFFLLLDFPDYTGSQALSASIKIMKNQKLRLFLLQLSFLPLMLLCVPTLFIGFLWLIPYMNMTYTLFFLDIMKTPKQPS